MTRYTTEEEILFHPVDAKLRDQIVAVEMKNGKKTLSFHLRGEKGMYAGMLQFRSEEKAREFLALLGSWKEQKYEQTYEDM